MMTAKKLSKSGVRGPDIATILRDQFEIIDSALTKAPKHWGRNVVNVELPLIFNIPGLATGDAQRLIYSSILKRMIDNGLNPRITMTQKRTVLYLQWVADIDQKEVDAMSSLIKRCRLSYDDVPAFLEGTDEQTIKIPSSLPRKNTTRQKKSKTKEEEPATDFATTVPDWAADPKPTLPT